MEKERKETVTERIIRLISKKWYTRKKLREKLLKEGYPELEIEESIQAFEKDGYIDDEFFLKNYLEEKRKSHPRGYWAYKLELERLGIDDNLLELLRSSYFPLSEEIKDGAALINHWLQQGEKNQEKLFQRLLQRGFSYETAEASWNHYQLNREELKP